MSGPRVRKTRDERREQILSCASKVFREHPYEQVSSGDLAAAAGVSRGLLNHYFGTKRELYLAVVGRMLESPGIHVPSYVAGASVRDRVAESVTMWLDLLERSSSTWLAVLDRASSGGDAEMRRLLEDAREGVIERLTEVIGLASAAADHPEIKGALGAFSGFAEAASREWLRHGRLSRPQIHQLLESALFNLIEVAIPQLLAPAAVTAP
ncbi:TetR/AcrR family transcriptional regulator [Spirillospora sp. NPDC047279]|uniref:TetR/AcrR family transcriptional regulator n=1 Tax=Spirillospora sp. NPDC047279 TaxID=3155478 RepID=UPI0033EF1CD3